MKKKKSYYEIYCEWTHDTLKYYGICEALENNEIHPKEFLDIFKPTKKEYFGHDVYERDVEDYYWGISGEYGCWLSQFNITGKLSPLRQNMLLFMAAMNGEL